jgi:hypothetical protein
MEHLHALELMLHNERERLARSKTESERALRAVWVRQTEKEIAAEYAFLGKEQPKPFDGDDDALLAALLS